MRFIPYGKQSIDEDDITAVIEVLKSDWITQGPKVALFEEALKTYCDAQHAFAVCNATAALHLAYLALGVTKGDRVWTSPNTFLATANAALMCGAQVDFVDICSKTYNMSIEALEYKLKTAKQNGKLPKVVAPVHFAGQSCDMQAIYALSQEYGFKILEDAAHAIGGKYLDKPIGSCQFSDITIFSFHPVKIITTGEGGALLTNDKILANNIALLRSHGMTRDESLMDQPSEGAWYYQMIELGYNYRITDIQSALGLSQMKQLDHFVTKRHEVRKKYDELLINLPEVITPWQDEKSYSALHLYPIQVPAAKRKKVFDHLRNNNIGVNVHYIPVYMQPYYQKLGFKKGYGPMAESYYDRVISLPMYSTLNESEIEYVIMKLRESF